MLSNALAFLKKDAANAATFMPLAAGGGPAGHVPSPDSLPLILRVSTVGPSYGRVLTNFLAAKTLKRKVLISAWSCDHPHSRRHARTGRRPRRMEKKRTLSLGQGVRKCEVASSEIEEIRLSEQDKLEIIRMPHTQIDGTRVNFV